MEKYEEKFKKFLKEENGDYNDPQYWIDQMKQHHDKHVEAGIVDPNEEPNEDLDNFDLLYNAYEEAVSFNAPEEVLQQLKDMYEAAEAKINEGDNFGDDIGNAGGDIGGDYFPDSSDGNNPIYDKMDQLANQQEVEKFLNAAENLMTELTNHGFEVKDVFGYLDDILKWNV
jgi:hypothetical protein